MLTKPFVFVVQVVATIFGTEAAEYKSVLTDPSHGWKELHGIEIPLRGHRCLIEEAALSLVPTPTHAPTSVTSATSDLPTAIRSHVPPSNFSGPGSGTQGEMLTKPFVFVVQVVATIFGTEAAEYKSVLTDPSHGWKELHGIEIPLRGHRCLIEEAALSLVPTPTHAPTSVTSATSDLPTAIRSHVPPSNFSGPGSGTQGEMLTKPFVFVVQVVATIFGTEAAEYKSVLTDPSHGWKELHGIEIPLRGHRCLIEEAALSLVPTPTHAPTSVTSATSDLPTAIRSHVPPSNFSGPGSGTQGEMLTKPFVFVVQLF
ncbi:uncharacterized protein LOC142768911 [Rhipicephalus microplus]|uniref:uncharacterized protein LOC142768911 n=1 Tax=Rhipicephalus microplus TaxID=6941 RepID=UPI003F6AD93A